MVLYGAPAGAVDAPVSLMPGNGVSPSVTDVDEDDYGSCGSQDYFSFITLYSHWLQFHASVGCGFVQLCFAVGQMPGNNVSPTVRELTVYSLFIHNLCSKITSIDKCVLLRLSNVDLLCGFWQLVAAARKWSEPIIGDRSG